MASVDSARTDTYDDLPGRQPVAELTDSGTVRATPSLERLTAEADRAEQVRRQDLRDGDFVIVTTRNSTYTLGVLGDGRYLVSGGWFDRQRLSPHRVAISGCTWGGSAIQQDVVAAPGLFLEFGNRVMTTRIRRVEVMRDVAPSAIH